MRFLRKFGVRECRISEELPRIFVSSCARFLVARSAFRCVWKAASRSGLGDFTRSGSETVEPRGDR